MPGTPHPTHGLRRPSQPTSPTPSDPRFHLGSSLVDGDSVGSGSASASGSHGYGYAQHPLMLRSASSSASTSSLLERALLSAGSYVGGGVSRMLASGNNSPNGSEASSGGGLGQDGGPGSHPLKHGWNSAGEESSGDEIDDDDQERNRGRLASSGAMTGQPDGARLSPAEGSGLAQPKLERKPSSASSRRAVASAGSSRHDPEFSSLHPSSANGQPSSSAGDDDRSSSATDGQSGPSMLSVSSTPAHSQPSTSTASLSTTTAPTTTSSGTVGGGGKACSSTAGSDAGGGSASAAASTATSGSDAPVQAGLKGMAQAARQAKAASAAGQTGLLGANEHGVDTTSLDANDTDVDGTGRSAGEEVEHPLSERNLDRRGYHSFLCLGRPFHVEKRWKLVRELGQGAYGLVVSAQDEISGETIAIKMITRVLDKVVLARRALREITLLRHFASHENITGLIDLDVVHSGYNEVYMFMEPMEADLHQIIRSGQLLSNSHVQYFMYQLFRGMKFIHSAHVLHRDIKPGNVLVNADCELKICDFGLARGFYPDGLGHDASAGSPLTEYVATRWYRAPEIMLSYRRYTTAIDVWSIGCILAELLGAKPIFKGKDYVDQLNLILSVLGTPDNETLTRVGSDKACKYIRSLPRVEPVDFATLYPEADPLALDLLAKLLIFDPARRISVVEALEHPYLASYHDESDEPSCPVPFDKWVEVEGLTKIDDFRAAIEKEVNEFRAEVRAVDELDPPWTEAEYREGGEHSLLVSGESPMYPGEPAGSRYVSDILSAAAAEERASASGTDNGRESVIATTVESPRNQEPVDEVDPLQVQQPISRSVSPGGYFRGVSSGPSSPHPESFAPPRSAGIAPSRPGAHSRSSSRSSAHRRPSSGFFDPFGRRPTSLTFTPSPTAAGFPSGASHGSPVNASTSAAPSSSDGSGVIRPPRSRHHSASGDSLVRPLLRSLSTISVTDALGNGFALGGFSKISPAPPISPPPMVVSPSDAPPSAPPLALRPSTEQIPQVPAASPAIDQAPEVAPLPAA